MDTRLRTDKLAAMARAKRGADGLRATAREIDISASTLSRIEQGKVPDIETFIQLCDWLEVSPSEFFETDEEEGTVMPTFSPDMSTPERIEFHLRADKELNQETAEALANMVKAAYVAVMAGKLGYRPEE
ncbi:MAG: helix-turn-helix domain-containing protein [Anaerolineae bacterium]|nr:helix-turn-helix domain-containing protein [Anaerolineae bacterium]MCO5188139.1 helix-turn-helix domain-containing protein [Anaerolineae bacterium]MCO5193011.1 helix-turn-helix domain-containing protein [Anaerolineae bacterium]MCO5205613.1 helix-turn-helix domain-containing protein [Anaerolineae bacterium]